jgi:sugar O-acyltransferase (sialic acid O-acetyltransferase NeuD family)
MTKQISILGAGGLGREVKQLIEEINIHQRIWKLHGFYDDQREPGTFINGIPVLGGINEAIMSDCEEFVIAIANPSALKEISTKFFACGKSFPNIIHPLSSMGCCETNEVGVGNVFANGFHMTANIKIGDFNVFNTRVTLGHDVCVGSFNVFFPNVQVSGNVSIADENIFGMNSSILQKKSIGSRNQIGAHSFVATNINSDLSVFGIPAVKI